MAKIAHATALQEQSCDDFTWKFSQEFGAIQTAIAVSDLVDKGRSLDFYRRCEAGYSREYRNARKELKELQAERRKYEQAILDDGGDSTDFECFEENCEPTEPDSVLQNRDGVGHPLPQPDPSEKSAEPTEPELTPITSRAREQAVLPAIHPHPGAAGTTIPAATRVPIWRTASLNPRCDSDTIES
jgi:hypothetical protein